MQPNAPNSTMSANLEQTFGQQAIRLSGTVQSHGFLMSVDIFTQRIVQVSSGIVRHWPGLPSALSLVGAPVFDWIERGIAVGTLALDTLPRSAPMTLPWRPRFERTAPEPEAPDPARWECLGHRSGDVAVLEWLPQAIAPDRNPVQAAARCPAPGAEQLAERISSSLADRVVGMEALVRWNHPTRGQTPPATFIPLAERGDQIVQIDRWVMRHAIEAQARWRAQGLATLPVAVNLSMADILSSNLVEYLSELLDEFQVPADALEVEVTESCAMRELGKTSSVLSALNQRGIATTLDDFGTGFSSLSYLRQLPLQSITYSMLQDPSAETLTQAIVAMGVALKMLVVAEGVESEKQMNWLLAHGCHLGQGYFFSPPVDSDAIQQVIERIETRLAGSGLH